jgi:hypothetical protein
MIDFGIRAHDTTDIAYHVGPRGRVLNPLERTRAELKLAGPEWRNTQARQHESRWDWTTAQRASRRVPEETADGIAQAPGDSAVCQFV